MQILSFSNLQKFNKVLIIHGGMLFNIFCDNTLDWFYALYGIGCNQQFKRHTKTQRIVKLPAVLKISMPTLLIAAHSLLWVISPGTAALQNIETILNFYTAPLLISCWVDETELFRAWIMGYTEHQETQILRERWRVTRRRKKTH